MVAKEVVITVGFLTCYSSYYSGKLFYLESYKDLRNPTKGQQAPII